MGNLPQANHKGAELHRNSCVACPVLVRAYFIQSLQTKGDAEGLVLYRKDGYIIWPSYNIQAYLIWSCFVP